MDTYDIFITLDIAKDSFRNMVLKIDRILKEYSIFPYVDPYSLFQLHEYEEDSETFHYYESEPVSNLTNERIANHQTGGWMEYVFKGQNFVVDYNKEYDFSFVVLFIPNDIFKKNTFFLKEMISKLISLVDYKTIEEGLMFFDSFDVEEYFLKL